MFLKSSCREKKDSIDWQNIISVTFRISFGHILLELVSLSFVQVSWQAEQHLFFLPLLQIYNFSYSFLI